MAAKVVYTTVANGSSLGGTLFADKVFWIAQRTPSRSHFVSLVESNGGTVTALEKNADYLICDHMRKDNPAGALSYKFIEDSLRDGTIAPSQQHACGPIHGAPRALGAPTLARQSRVPFTPEDDRLLYSWVHEAQSRGARVLGNVIFQDLEYTNSRHTWQSWRDRYVKILRVKPPGNWEGHVLEVSQSMAARNRTLEQQEQARPRAVPAPSLAESERSLESQRKPRTQASPQPHQTPHATPPSVLPFPGRKHKAQPSQQETPKEVPFRPRNLYELLKNYDAIADTPYRRFVKTWDAFAEETEHTSEEWQEFFKITATKFHDAYMSDADHGRTILRAMRKWVAENEDATLEDWMSYWRRTLKPKVLAKDNGSAGKKLKLEHEATQAARSGLSLDGAALSVPEKSTIASPPSSKKRKPGKRLEDSPLQDRMKRRKLPTKTIDLGIKVEQDDRVDNERRMPDATATSESPSTAASQEASAVEMDDEGEDLAGEVPPTQSITQVTVSSANASTSNEDTITDQDAALQQIIAESSLRQVQSSAESTKGRDVLSTPHKQRVSVHSQEQIASPQQGYSLLKAAATTSQFYDTQAVFVIETQDLEFDLPEPDGGFEDDPIEDAVDKQDAGSENLEAADAWALVDPDGGYVEEEELFIPTLPIENDYALAPLLNFETTKETKVEEAQNTGEDDEFSDHSQESGVENGNVAVTIGGPNRISPLNQVPPAIVYESESSDDSDGEDDTEDGAQTNDGSHAISAPNFAASAQRRAPSEELGGDDDRVATIAERQISISSDEPSSGSSKDGSDSYDDESGDEDDQAAIREAYEERGVQPDAQASHDSDGISQIENLGTLWRTLRAQGFSESIIKQAVRAANCEPELTRRTCRALQADGLIPAGVAGVWTANNDKQLAEKGITRELLAKHGEEGCEHRRLFLAEIKAMKKWHVQ